MKITIEYDKDKNQASINGFNGEESFDFTVDFDCDNDNPNLDSAERNLKIFTQHILTSHDWDYYWLMEILKIKLSSMADYFDDANIVVESKNISKEIKLALKMIDKCDNFDENWFKKKEGKKLDKHDYMEMFKSKDKAFRTAFGYIGRKIQGWWD